MKDRDFLKTSVGFEISDMNFKHHTENQNTLNICIISFQFILCVCSLFISAITQYNISKYTALINVVLLLIVLLNNFISKRAWKNAQNRQEKIIAMYDLIDDDKLSEEDIHYHLSKLKGYNIKHSDDRFENLMNKWYKNLDINKREKLVYKDDKGINYHIGDIVYNPAFGDIWLVEKLSDEDMQKFNFDIPYVLTQYGDEDEYIIPIDEPKGFVIKSTPTEIYQYVKFISVFNKAYVALKKELAFYEKEGKKDGKQIGTEKSK